jgi:hypothetical protein
MKQNTLTGIALTLIMILLVAAAAFIFLFQGRQSLQDEMATQTAVQSQQLLQTGSDLAAAEATRDVTLEAVATNEADRVRLEGELVASQHQVDELTGELATQTAELQNKTDDLGTVRNNLENANNMLIEIETTRQASELQLPVVRLILPPEGSAFAPNEAIDIVFAASDPKGITGVTLQVNGTIIQNYSPDNETLFATQANWMAEEPGEYVIGVSAININNSSSTPITTTIQILPPPPSPSSSPPPAGP